MKIVFLDIDGCIKTEYGKFNQKSIHSLREIIERTGAKVVLSSGWRMSFDENMRPLNENADQLVDILRANGIEIIGKVENTKSKELKNCSINELRAKQIKNYLEKNYVEGYLVIDDLYLGKALEDNQIVVKHSQGLSWRDVKKAVDILKR